MEVSNPPGNKFYSCEDWVQSWSDGDIPFHQQKVHSFLEKHFSVMTNGKSELKILFPLCGKDVSIKWLADQGHTVVGIEISSLALKDFFKEQNLEYTEETAENFTVYKSKDSKIIFYCGDMFLFPSVYKDKFDGVWDRGALVALNIADREKYVEVVKQVLAPDARYLLVTHEYDQAKMNGNYSLEKLEERDMLKWFNEKEETGIGNELESMMEVLYLLQPQSNPETANPQADRQLAEEDWSESWENQKIGWHKADVNQTLEKHFTLLTKGRAELKIFVPLCGKSLDLKWLADQGHIVVGVEIVPMAIKNFFQEQELEYTEEKIDSFTLYKSKDSRIYLYCGDVFKFSSQFHGPIDAVWDRASLVAINPRDRERYASLMKQLISPQGKYLLSVFDYDASKMPGPPFSVPMATVHNLFEDKFSLQWLDHSDGLNQRWKDRGVEWVNLRSCILTPKTS